MHIGLNANGSTAVVCSILGEGMLSSEQISFFKANGYLILPGVMDLELCARVRDAM